MSEEALAEGQQVFASRRSASTPSSGDARRHGARGRRAASGRARPSSTPTARRALLRRPRRAAPTRWPPGCARRASGPGDVVLLRLPSDSTYVVAYAAAAKVGAITAGVNPRLAPPEQAAVGRGRPAARSSSTPPTRWRRCADPEPVAPLDDDPERPVALVFTSGTTGRAEGGAVPRTGSWPPSPASTSPTPGATRRAEPTPMLAGTQFAHVGLHDQAAVVPAARHDHPHPRPLAGRRRAGVHRRAPDPVARRGGPADGAAAARGPRAPTTSSCVQTIVMGGAASPPAMVREAMARFDAAYSIRYSSTESGGCGTGTAFDADDEEALFTVGRPRGGIEVGICDDEAGPLPDGEVGEVWLRSPTSMSGYWRDDEAHRPRRRPGLAAHRRPRLHRRARAACAWPVGSRRCSSAVGYNVYPAEVESVLADHPPVADVVDRAPPRRRDGRDRRRGRRARRRRPAARPSRSCGRSSSRGWRATSCPRRSAIVDAHPAHPDAEGRPPRPGRRGVANRDPDGCHPGRWWVTRALRTEAPGRPSAAAAAAPVAGPAARRWACSSASAGSWCSTRPTTRRGDGAPTPRWPADGERDRACARGPRSRTAPGWCWWSGCPASPTPTDPLVDRLVDAGVGGVMLRDENIVDEEQAAELVAGLRARLGRAPARGHRRRRRARHRDGRARPAGALGPHARPARAPTRPRSSARRWASWPARSTSTGCSRPSSTSTTVPPTG